MRLLFVKESLAWPRSSGHDVHCFYMMQGLAELGHSIGLLTAAPPSAEAIAGLPLAWADTFAQIPPRPETPLLLTRLQERFRSYWGIDPARIRSVAHAADQFDADAVVVVGLNVLPYLGAVQGRLRVWYAADEWLWHHFSQVRLHRRSSWGEVKQALVKGLYERAYGPLLDRVWVVTDRDGRAMRWVAGTRVIDVIPNGVDSEHYRPLAAAQIERSCTFWGRLDFGPNIQGLEWFCRRVWPLVRRHVPDARFTIYGFNPGVAVRDLVGRDGIGLVADLPDLRGEVARHQAVVLPFVSGGGIKNKLLEAASMAKATVCTPWACGGLHRPAEWPFLVARHPQHWVEPLASLWSDANRRHTLGTAARDWVLTNHTWLAAAQTAANGLASSAKERLR